MENGEVTDRLRQLGRGGIEPDLASRHLSALAATKPAGRHPLARVAVAATAATLLVAAPGAALVISALRDDPAPVSPTEQEVPTDGFTCTGPPPFAGEPGAEEVEAFAEWRATNCPDDEVDDDTTTTDTTGTTVVGEPTDEGTDDDCTGPPDFAGEPAVPADPGSGQVPSQRAEEAREHAEERQACNGNGNEDQVDRGGPPASVPGRGEPGGPRDDSQPAGPPEDPPGGPPAGVPGGPPTDVPVGGSGNGNGNGGSRGGAPAP